MANCIDCLYYRNKKLDVPREGKNYADWCANSKKNQMLSKSDMEKGCILFKEKLMTIVCCMGNKLIYNLRLGKSLEQYSPEQYDLIILPTTEPIPDTYNSINCNKIRTKYIMFVHEDVFFMTPDWLRVAKQLCDRVENLGIAGVAGVTRNSRTIGYVLHWGSRGMPRKRGFGEPQFDEKIIPVQTLDAQCMIVPTEVFKKVRFNPEFPFHMMTEDYCLSMGYIHQRKVVVIPLKVWHNEGGIGRVKLHGNLANWHVKLWQKWHDRTKPHGIHVTSKAFGIKGNEAKLPKGIIYCPKCGADADTLTNHMSNPEFKFECRLCYHRWGRLRPPRPKKGVKK